MTTELLNIGTLVRSDFQGLRTWKPRNLKFRERQVFETHSRISQEKENYKIRKEIKKKREIN